MVDPVFYEKWRNYCKKHRLIITKETEYLLTEKMDKL